MSNYEFEKICESCEKKFDSFVETICDDCHDEMDSDNTRFIAGLKQQLQAKDALISELSKCLTYSTELLSYHAEGMAGMGMDDEAEETEECIKESEKALEKIKQHRVGENGK